MSVENANNPSSPDLATMTGAESIVRTLIASDVDVCFTNPGTSEMHFVAALDRVQDMRCVLGLFEGVVTGAADGYGRMTGKPAATLLHLGPGFGNGVANLHNARRAHSPIVNIVGDHATYHKKYDAPLNSDVEGIARPFSAWVRSAKTAATAAGDAAEAVAVARGTPGKIATLVLPADCAWDEGRPAAPVAPKAGTMPDDSKFDAARTALSGNSPRTGIILGGTGLLGEAVQAAARIAARTGARLLSAYAVGRSERGVGSVKLQQIPYSVEPALAFLKDFDRLILIGGDLPVAFFAYPGKPSVLSPESCEILTLAGPADDIPATLERLAEDLGARTAEPLRNTLLLPDPGTGTPTAEMVARSIAAYLPENAVVVDESVTNGHVIGTHTAAARPHDFLKNVGGSIGFAMPASVGCAIACPDRKVVCLEGDGSGMYTLQALWTQAREQLNVLTVIFANRAYAVLRGELKNVGITTPGPRARDMLEIDRPTIDWVGMARSMGVEANRAETMDEVNRLLQAGMAATGPMLIEVVQ